MGADKDQPVGVEAKRNKTGTVQAAAVENAGRPLTPQHHAVGTGKAAEKGCGKTNGCPLAGNFMKTIAG